MSSLKMTFSLASLVLLIAFIAMPVMAHVADPADTTHNAATAMQVPDHALVESITVDTTRPESYKCNYGNCHICSCGRQGSRLCCGPAGSHGCTHHIGSTCYY